MSVTLLFQATFKTALAILSYVGRWASCRGALPQPLVIFVLAASAVSAPRKKRMLTVGFTLLAIRTVAEALHGYVHGNDYDDDYIETDIHETTSGAGEEDVEDEC